MAADAWSSIRKPRSTASPRASTFERPPRRWWTRWRTTGASGCEPQRGRDPLLYPYVARRRPYVRASKARAPHLGPRARLAPAHSAPGCIRNRRVTVFSEWDADGTVPLYLELVVRLTRARPSTGRASTSRGWAPAAPLLRVGCGDRNGAGGDGSFAGSTGAARGARLVNVRFERRVPPLVGRRHHVGMPEEPQRRPSPLPAMRPISSRAPAGARPA